MPRLGRFLVTGVEYWQATASNISRTLVPQHQLQSSSSPPAAPRLAAASARAHSTTSKNTSPSPSPSPPPPRRRPGPLKTAALLFPAAAIGVGVLSGLVPVYNPFSASPASGSMSDKLIPANPADVMVIRDVTPNVVTFSVPFKRFGIIPVGGRATVVKLTSGCLAVFSPVALTPDVQAKLTVLGGPVRYLIAPDIEHHIFLSDWARAFPDSKLIGPEGLPEKRAAATDPRIGAEPFAVVFRAQDKRAQTVDAEFDRDFAYEYVDAHANRELVFFFRPDRVLIEADLLFNLPAVEQYSRVPEAERRAGLPARLFIKINSTGGEAKGLKRFLWYAISARDRAGFDESVRRINKWDFVTLVPCHGETIVGNAKEVWAKVFDWHLTGK